MLITFETILLVVLAVAPFLRCVDGEFLYDDPTMFEGGPPPSPAYPYKGFLNFKVFHVSQRALGHVFDGWLWHHFGTSSTGMDGSNTRIIQPSRPWHVLSLAFHVGTTVCVWALAGHALPWIYTALGWGAPAPWRAWLAAAVFAVHPLQVGAVGYISGRAGIQAAFFSALGLLHAVAGGWHWLPAVVSQYLAYKSKPDGLVYLAFYPLVFFK